MIKHFASVAIRNLLRGGSFSLINILGLTLGISCSLLIYLWITDELSVDNFHEKGETLYRVYVRREIDGQVSANFNSPAALPAELKKNIPEVERATGFVKYFRLSLQDDVYETFQVDDKVHKMKGGRAEEDFFEMFTYPLLYGDPKTALDMPESIVVSRKMAEIYFGGPEAAMGKTMRFDNRKEVMVTGVFENVPVNSTDQFDYLMNWDAWVAETPFKQSWGHHGTSSYIQLRADADLASVEEKIKDFMMTREGAMPGIKMELGLQQFGDQYLFSNFENGMPSKGRIQYIKLFGALGVFILVIACINFMNLATARSARRAKEVGVRKVVGSSRRNLVFQFIGEALLITCLSTVLALVVTALALPQFNMLTNKQMTLPLSNPVFWYLMAGLVVFTGLAAGSYPSFFLSSFQPVKILKGSFTFNPKTVFLRKGLVVFQFGLSVVLMIATLVISRQTDYVQHANLGYDKENLIYVFIEGSLITKYNSFKLEASRVPGVKVVDRCSQFPHSMGFRTLAVGWPGRQPDEEVNFNVASVGYDFVEAMDLEIVDGRDFSGETRADSMNFLVNEEAARRMGLDEPVGAEINVFQKKGKIVGVLKDYHTSSLHDRIDPLVLDIKEDLNFGTILVRTEAGKTTEALAGLEKVSAQINPGFPFLYSFTDEQYAKLYKSEVVVSSLSNVFAVLAIFISCLGLLGLAMFSAQQRRKELSVRKVMGASVGNIVVEFSKDFLKLVFLALIISVPIAWIVMSWWLSDFAYKIELAWWLFAVGGVLAILISLLTISVQAIRSAVENPVKSLRSE